MGSENNEPTSCFANPSSVDRASQAPSVAGESFFQTHQSVVPDELGEADAYASVALALDRVRQLAILLARQAAAEDDAAERRKGVE